MDTRPIGVFDSGLGGLTVVSQIRALLPNESIVYLGDTARVPYGTRSKEVVVKFAKQDAQFLVGKNVKCVVIACNTASSWAANEVRQSMTIPVLDVVSSCMMSLVNIKKIGVIATRGTVNSHAYTNGIKKINPHALVIEKECPLFVPFIEEGIVKGKLIDMLIDNYLSDMRRNKVDTLVLGCTHYPMLANKIRNYMGKDVSLLDAGKTVAISLGQVLKDKNMQNNSRQPFHEYFVTDLTDNFVNVASWFLKEKLKKVQKISL
ncbi:glutamate racemase [Candidatus Woesebacteria bacterium]|nr:MAG: glutamate racemase [Candidatus Woesebacteria bacterium]